MNYHRQLTAPARLMLLAVLGLVTILSVPKLTKATGVIGKEDLSGAWTATLTGDTGCGISTSHVTFSLNSTGSGPATIQSHTSGCGNPISTGQVFTITSLNSNGSGTANLSCGTACGFNFDVQVSPDRATFSLVDITDPGNYLEGVAIHQ
jgi:hypothetical protein